MKSLLTLADGTGRPDLQGELQHATDLAACQQAAATRKAYDRDFKAFVVWCCARRVRALPASPEIVAAFLAYESKRGTKASTIGRICASIRNAHRAADVPTPTDTHKVKATMRGIRRVASASPRQKAPITAQLLIAMTAAAERGLVASRNRALLLLGFAGAFRRSELIGLDVADILESADGLRVTIHRSKTDQEGRGATIAIPRGTIACPIMALNEWLRGARIASGPIFRPINRHGRVQPRRLSEQTVATIVKNGVARLGLDPSRFSGHSLRAGFVTSAAARGASLFKLMDVTRHRKVESLRGYVRDAELFEDHAGAGLL
jgi:site-specific recombinase XerD